jgi:hypothetical protein
MSYVAEAPISAKLGGTALFSDAELDDFNTLQAREHFGLFRQAIRCSLCET